LRRRACDSRRGHDATPGHCVGKQDRPQSILEDSAPTRASSGVAGRDALDPIGPAPGTLRQLSLDLGPGSPAEFAAYLARERGRWEEIARLAHVEVE
jgi:hypothetical protein